MNAVLSMRIAALLLDMLQEIDMPVPVRRLVDFLKSDDIRRMAFDKPSYFLEILSNPVGAVESLVERKASSVRDVEAHDAERLCSFAGGWHVVVY